MLSIIQLIDTQAFDPGCLTYRTYRSNLVHYKAIAHLIFATIVCGAQSSEMSGAFHVLNNALNGLKHILNTQDDCNTKFCHELRNRLLVTRSNLPTVMFGHVFHLFHLIQQDQMIVTQDTIERWLRSEGKEIIDTLMASTVYGTPIADLYSDVAKELREQLACDFAYKHFIEFGFIPAATENLSILEVKSQTSVLDVALVDIKPAHTQVDLPDEREQALKTLKERSWEASFISNCEAFRNLSKQYLCFEKEINDEALNILKLIDSRSLGNLSVSQLLLQKEWPQIMRDIVLMRVILVLWEPGMTVPKLAGYMNYKSKQEKGSGSLEQHIVRLDLQVREVLRKWLTSKAIPEEDRAWAKQIKYHRAHSS
jgi:hypothetical protein